MTTPVVPKTATLKIPQKSGVDMYGLYAEGVVTYTASGTIHSYRRAFLVGSELYWYSRQPGKKSTIWKQSHKASPAAARESFAKFFASHPPARTCTLRGEALLIQLKLTDILEMEKGKAPASRYVGGAKIDAALGKFDEAEWAKAAAKADTAKALVEPPEWPVETPSIPATPTSPTGVSKSLPLNWKELLNG